MTRTMSPAMSGAMIGLMIGVVQYFVALFVTQKVVSREIADAAEAREDIPGLQSLGAIVRRMKFALLLLAIVVYPLVGYVAGKLLAA